MGFLQMLVRMAAILIVTIHLANSAGVAGPADPVKSVENLAEQGDHQAQYYLGLMYAREIGVHKDETQAAKWFRMAADQGDAEAQFFLGIQHFRGEGVKRNLLEAYKWTVLAADHGLEIAHHFRGIIAESMSRKQLEEAERQVTEWRNRGAD